MTGAQSRTLSTGERVRWRDDSGDLEVSWAGVTIKWDSRREQAILHNDTVDVFAVPKKMI